MELPPTLILNLVLLIVPPVALVLVFRQWLAWHRETPRMRRIQFSFILSQCCVLMFGLAGFRAAYQSSFPQK